jgi:DNA-binding Lrp family transcriptional regulator
MSRALVLFHVSSGSERQVLKDVKKVEEVEEAYVSYGPYDIEATIRTDYMDDLKKVIRDNLRKINGVRATSSLILVEE